MARIRTVKPEFFTSEDIVSLSAFARLLYIALWCEADKEGRMEWKPRTFKMRYLPADDVAIDALCKELIERRLIVLYGNGLAFIPGFAKHQHINPRESASILPAPDASARVTHASARDSDAQVGREGKGREGKGREDASHASDDRDAVLSAYHSILPKCQQIAVLNDKRKKRIAEAVRLAKSVCREQGWPYEALNFWNAYFTECATDPWMRGEVPNPKNPSWKQNLDVLLAEDRFAGVMDRAIEALRSAA